MLCMTCWCTDGREEERERRERGREKHLSGFGCHVSDTDMMTPTTMTPISVNKHLPSQSAICVSKFNLSLEFEER